MTDETTALVEETTPAPEPEPIPLPESLEVWEEGMEATNPDMPAPRLIFETAADAARIMARVHHFAQQKAFFAEPYEAEIKRLRGLLSDLEAEKAKVEAQWDARAAWYRSSLEVWARQMNAADPKIKSIALPYGALKVRAQQAEWTYDEETLTAWLKENRPELVRTKFEPIKTDLKKAVKVNEGHALDPQTGEIIPGVTITERPPKFELEVTL